MKTTSAKPTNNFLVSHFNRVHPIDWTKEFKRKAPIHLEIGFGNGEFLIRQSKENPRHNFIGIEIENLLIKKASKRITRANAKNVRLLKLDVNIALERLFAQRCLDSVYTLFPFPWPKKRHYHHRLFNKTFLKLVNSRLKTKGAVRIVTDFKPYYEWVLLRTPNTGFKTKKKTIDPHFNTQFERKWAEEGQKSFYQIDLKKINHISTKVLKEENVTATFIKDFNPKLYAPKNKTGTTSIIFKKFFFNSKENCGTQNMLVAEKNLTQKFRVLICPQGKKWCVSLDHDQDIIKTKGVKESLLQIKKACPKI
ncbi:MAG: tRNA (guanosine(46)-N7)-methyltransferase TrmB [Candidatus Aceula meridiana]|nr:tRNA (guanosine(46)-N7)-methyltransferase TrmB [Candidatus Aceula meridiana]